jgi:hypothetical protein
MVCVGLECYSPMLWYDVGSIMDVNHDRKQPAEHGCQSWVDVMASSHFMGSSLMMMTISSVTPCTACDHHVVRLCINHHVGAV